jgi:hypothetical protein
MSAEYMSASKNDRFRGRFSLGQSILQNMVTYKVF